MQILLAPLDDDLSIHCQDQYKAIETTAHRLIRRSPQYRSQYTEICSLFKNELFSLERVKRYATECLDNPLHVPIGLRLSLHDEVRRYVDERPSSSDSTTSNTQGVQIRQENSPTRGL